MLPVSSRSNTDAAAGACAQIYVTFGIAKFVAKFIMLARCAQRRQIATPELLVCCGMRIALIGV